MEMGVVNIVYLLTQTARPGPAGLSTQGKAAHMDPSLPQGVRWFLTALPWPALQASGLPGRPTASCSKSFLSIQICACVLNRFTLV